MVLIVDDDPRFLEEARSKLDVGKGVFLAANAVHAKSLMSTVGSTFSLVLVDLDMRGQNGFDLIAEFHANFPELPIIAMSGVYQTDVLESAKALGAVAVLQKPIDDDWLPVIRSMRGKTERA